MVNAVDDFISLHTEACRKHGRYICGVCSFQRECTKCACLKYVNPGHAEGVCARCNHPPSFHRTVPLFLKKKSQKNAMRAILQLKVYTRTHAHMHTHSLTYIHTYIHTSRPSLFLTPTHSHTALYCRTARAGHECPGNPKRSGEFEVRGGHSH